MKTRYRLLQSSCVNIPTLYNTYEVGEEPNMKKSLIFFNEEIQKYGVEEDLEYNVLIFNREEHPNILHMVDRVEYDHGQEHMFEYFENSLESYVINYVGKIQEKQVLDILKQVINAVDGIIARKCYPQNLRPEHFVQVKGNWKIRCVVFGEDDSKCKDLDSQYTWNPYYIPPQLYSRNNQVSLSSELVWSIGCIGLFLVQKQHKLSTLNAIKQTYNKQFNHLSPKLSQFFKNTLNPNPSKRVKWAQIKDFLQNPQKKVNFQLLTQSIQHIDTIQDDLRMSKSMKLKESSQYFMMHKLNQSVKFGLKSVFEMPDSLLRSRSDVRMQLASSQFGKLTLKNTKQIGKQTVYNMMKGSKLLIQSGRSIKNNTEGDEEQDEDNFLHEIRERQQTNGKNKQFFVIINQKISQSTSPQRKISYKHDTQSNRFKQIYIKLNTQKNTPTKFNLISIINAYRQQRQVSQYCFHIRQQFQNFSLPNQQKILFKLAQCTFLLLSILNISQPLSDLVIGQCRFNLSPEIFKQFKNSIYYQQIKNTFQSSYQRYLQHFKNQVQSLKQFYYSPGCTMQKYCLYLIKIASKNILSQLTISELKKQDYYLSLMSKLYDICKRQYISNQSKIESLKLMIKLLIIRVSDKIIKEENRCVFQEYFKGKGIGKGEGNLYMLEYLEFLEECEDRDVLQRHKDKIAKHKYIG